MRALISIGLGALMPFAFAPFGYWWLAPILIASLLWLIKDTSPKKSFGISYLFGLSFFTVGLWWVRISVNEFGGAPLALAIVMVFLLSGYLALYYGVLGYLIKQFKFPPKLLYLLLFPVIGTLLEVLRAHLFTGFPWLALGYSLTETSSAQYLFPIYGALISSFVVYWCAGLLMFIAQAIIQKNIFSIFMPIMMSWILYITSTALLTAALNDPIKDLSETVNISLVQGNITQDKKFDDNSFFASIKTYLDLTDKVIDKADLVVWPETAVVSYYNYSDDLLNNLREWSDLTDANILLGIPRNDANYNQFNSFVLLGETAQQDQFYDKYRLLPFGEYIPLPEIFSVIYHWINMPLSGFSKGPAEQKPFEFAKFSTKATGSICFEAVFGETLRYQAKQGGFLVNVSNDAWFGNSLAPWQHLQIVQARAIEFARPITRATNTGLTAFVDSHGKVIAKAPLFEEATLSETITGKQGLTAYVKFGDQPWIIVLMTLFMICIGYHLAQRKHKATK